MAFNACRVFPHPTVPNIMMGHRTVVLPDWQGIGIGWRFEEWLGAFLTRHGYRYHNVTSHPGLRVPFDRSQRWRARPHISERELGTERLRGARADFARGSLDIRRMGTRNYVYRPIVGANPEWLVIDPEQRPFWSKR